MGVDVEIRPGGGVVTRPKPLRPLSGGTVRPYRPPARIGRGPSTRGLSPQLERFITYAALVVIVLVLGGRTVAAVSAAPSAPSAAAAAPAAAAFGAAAPFAGGPAGCSIKDPSGTGGCVTAVTSHALDEIRRQVGGFRNGPIIGSAGCWDRHAWNPTSDHPRGKACDFFPAGGKAGQFAKGAPLDHGWALANWARANAAALHVHYVIWQGRIWDTVQRTGDAGGWGHPYDGGGIYNAATATGGHFDHVHISFRD